MLSMLGAGVVDILLKPGTPSCWEMQSWGVFWGSGADNEQRKKQIIFERLRSTASRCSVEDGIQYSFLQNRIVVNSHQIATNGNLIIMNGNIIDTYQIGINCNKYQWLIVNDC